MFNTHDDAARGPNQLDALADQTEGQGLQVTAEGLRALAREWRRDQHALQAAESTLAIAAKPERLLAQLGRGHAITPSSR
ncbi:hypothetical protein [Marilutibacter aestuarii]|uniref:Uncharacterized protein n=1 Tax=Marilutibacter aestuarii TaxID=1706195 RepID=A0A508AM69_9GAMM|nr:hypothetical protein [Lysobacter aestuarii]TQD51210.1 hypothetical protein FKV25_01905 [Lysobacter aestuarii]